eukprot:CAMPEP_0114573144 /NCGR_PEP_ID=MMETSP0114-20121206/18702_1 /TAXON_ID=31324 /ORGANISM="Goniomonas sp, Strain m" /LENGTH=110 /DNA_ID=CAMNT_0001760469 /DNA_START=397 /DNA_END=729 /DNA_ORIENTATION=+
MVLEEKERAKAKRRVLQSTAFVPNNGGQAKEALRSFVSLDSRDDRDLGWAYVWERMSSRQRSAMALSDLGTPDARASSRRKARQLAEAALAYEITLHTSGQQPGGPYTAR